MALCQTQPSRSISPLFWEAQPQPQNSQCASPVLSRGKDHLPRPAGSALSNAAQEAVCLLCHEVTLLAHGQLVIHQDPKVLLSKSVLHLVSPQSIWVPGAAVLHMQDLTQLFEKFMRSLSAHFSSLLSLHPSGWAAWPSDLSATLPKLHHQQTCWGYTAPSSR